MLAVRIHPRMRKFLDFQVNDITLQFIVLVFGFALGPRIFTKVTKVLAYILSTKQVDVSLYLDDLMFSAPNPAGAARMLAKAIHDAERLGFQFNNPSPL